MPRAFHDDGVRRYGFHGLSYEFVAGRLREVTPEIADGRVVVPYAQLPTSRLLLGGTGNAALVDRALAGLDVAGGQTATLIESLRVFLAEVGSWEAAAAQLGVHRHTLRHRIARVEALTGRDLSRMEDRVELWVALRARGLLD